jgi:phosphomannomutase
MPLMVSVSGVRGTVGPELNPLVVSRWTAAFGTLLSPGPIVLGRDSRTTGEALAAAASSILRAIGREVWDLGIVPTPTVQMAVERWGASGGIILSASHNPGEWNALKFVDADGSFLLPQRFGALRVLADSGEVHFSDAAGYGSGRDRRDEALALHRQAVLDSVDVDTIRSSGLTVALDCGHGAGGTLLPILAAALRVRLDGRNLEADGRFAANPEPTSETLKAAFRDLPAEIAFAALVDPDADRLAVALPGTSFASEEWTLPLVAWGRLARRPGPLVTNLSTSTRLEAAAERFGATVYRAPVGEANVVGEMKARGAVLGGEGNGGIIDPEVHYGRDSAVAFARLCEVEANQAGGLREVARLFPPRCMRKEKLPLPPGGLRGLEETLAQVLGQPDNRMDGLRWSRPDGFIHLRASGTEPILRAVLEAGSEEALASAIEDLRRIIQ